jgi:hypothetical protein
MAQESRPGEIFPQSGIYTDYPRSGACGHAARGHGDQGPPVSDLPALQGREVRAHPCGQACRRDRPSRGMPLAVPPPRDSRFGSPLVLSRVHWVQPELVAEVKFLTWTDDNLLRQVVYEGLREDKPAAEVRRDVPHPNR